MLRNLLKSLLDESEEDLTNNGRKLKRLAERLETEDYELTEEDKNIMDQSWRKIWR